MSEALETLKAILREKLPEGEVQAFMAELTIASGDGAVAISGNATEAVIITGSQNIVGDNNRVVINQGTEPEELAKILRSLLREMQQVDSTPELSVEELRAATVAFLQDVQNRFMETRLFHTKQPVILKDQYIPIQVTLEPHKRDVETVRGYWETEEELKRAYALKRGEQQAEEELKRQQVDWKEVKPKHQRIMVLADPGMGKSTLLRMEAGITAQEELKKLRENQTTSEETDLPLFLRLSELAKRSEELIEAIPSLIQRDYPNTASPLLTFLIEKLKTGKCLLLLDALDEVSKLERNRIELQEKLDRFLSNYPCRVICTSRIVGYDGSFLGHGQEVEIVPFQEVQIEEYVKTWFTNAKGHLSNQSVSAAELLRELRNKPQVRGLVQNPLLLSLICSLYQEKGLTLPARRAQVYEKAVEYMLEKWNQTRQSQFPGKTRAKIRLLEALAYHFSCEDEEVFDVDDIYDWIGDYLLDEQVQKAFKDVDPEALIDELSQQDGILQKLNPDDDQYLFLHRTFQEYLTACYLERAKNGIELAKEHFWEYDWHETITLMAGLMKKSLPLLQAITTEKDDIFQTQLLLAGRCLAECEESSLPLVEEIIDRIYQFWLAHPDTKFIRSPLVTIGQTHTSLFEHLKASLNDDDSGVRCRAVEALGEVGSDKAVYALIAALNDEYSEVRSYATGALGKIGNNKAMDALIVALNDETSKVRGNAAEALRLIGGDRAVDALTAALNDESAYVRGNAAQALGEVGSDKAVYALIAALNDEYSEVRSYAAQALGRIGNDKAMDALIVTLNDKNVNVRSRAVGALGRIDGDKAMDALIAALNNENSEVRSNAVEALGRGQIGTDKAIDALIVALNDETSKVRGNAAEALRLIGGDRAVDALTAALNDESAYVRGNAAQALGKVGSDRAVDALTAALNDESAYVRSYAAQALGRIGGKKAVDALTAALNGKNWLTAAIELGGLSEKAVDALIAAFKDDDRDLRREVAGILGTIRAEKAVDALIVALSYDYFDVRERAAEALALIGNEKAVDALTVALNDRHGPVRAMAAWKIGQVGNEKDVDALVTALNDEDNEVRRSAVEALAQMNHSSCLEELLQSPQINLYDSDIFFLARSLAVRFHKAGLEFIPVYPEVVEQYRKN